MSALVIVCTGWWPAERLSADTLVGSHSISWTWGALYFRFQTLLQLLSDCPDPICNLTALTMIHLFRKPGLPWVCLVIWGQACRLGVGLEGGTPSSFAVSWVSCEKKIFFAGLGSYTAEWNGKELTLDSTPWANKYNSQPTAAPPTAPFQEAVHWVMYGSRPFWFESFCLLNPTLNFLRSPRLMEDSVWCPQKRQILKVSTLYFFKLLVEEEHTYQ